MFCASVTGTCGEEGSERSASRSRGGSAVEAPNVGGSGHTTPKLPASDTMEQPQAEDSGDDILADAMGAGEASRTLWGSQSMAKTNAKMDSELAAIRTQTSAQVAEFIRRAQAGLEKNSAQTDKLAEKVGEGQAQTERLRFQVVEVSHRRTLGIPR